MAASVASLNLQIKESWGLTVNFIEIKPDKFSSIHQYFDAYVRHQIQDVVSCLSTPRLLHSFLIWPKQRRRHDRAGLHYVSGTLDIVYVVYWHAIVFSSCLWAL